MIANIKMIVKQDASIQADIPSKLELVKDGMGGFNAVIDGVDFGTFDQLDVDGLFSFFPRRNDRLTGDHYIAIGKALNELNNPNQ